MLEAVPTFDFDLHHNLSQGSPTHQMKVDGITWETISKADTGGQVQTQTDGVRTPLCALGPHSNQQYTYCKTGSTFGLTSKTV